MSLFYRFNRLQFIESIDCNSNRGATRTFARGGNILFCNGRGGGVKGGFPPFSKIYQKQKCFFLRVWSRKKGNFKLLHADLAVFNSKRFFFLCFYKIYTSNSCKMNDMSQFIIIEYVCESQEYFLSTWSNYRLNCKK